MRNVIPDRGGRFIDPLDIDLRRRVIFIGSKLKDELFKDEPAIGKYVMMNSVPLQVVGVLIKKTQNSSYGTRDENAAFIPATTFAALFGDKYVNNIIIQAHNPSKNKVIRAGLLRVLGKRYRFDPKDTEALLIWDVMENQKLTDAITLGFSLFLGIVGAFTMIVGGIGVSNIMNVVVEERTKEIGLKMALGAKKKFVLSQFLFETLLITLAGGVVGLAVSYFVIQVFPRTKIEEEIGRPVFSLGSALITVGLLGIIGFVSGYSPARRAANLNPVEAIKS
jgi:putative ABC transport system permease protein